MTAIDPQLLSIARWGLPGAPPPTPGGWGERLDSVIANGLAGIFAASAAAGMVEIDAAMADRLRQQLQLEATRAVQLEGELLRLAPALARVGALVMRGPVLAHGAYPDPLFRPFSRLDLLVAGRRMPEAIAVFAHFGYRHAQPATGSALDTRVGKAFVLEHPGGVIIHLHRTLAATSIGNDTGDPATGHREVMIGPQPVPAPSWEAHLLECALDAVVRDGLAHPLALRDVAEVVQHPRLDPLAAVELAETWQIARPVGHSLGAARACLGLDLPPAFAALARRSAQAPPVAGAFVHTPEPASERARPAPPLRSVGPVGTAVAVHSSAHSEADVPALRAEVPAINSEIATVSLPGRSAHSPLLTLHRNGTAHTGAALTAGRQGAWTGARPPRQGASRTRGRPGQSGSGHGSARDRSSDDGDGPGAGGDGSASEPGPEARASVTPPTRLGLALGLAGGALLVAVAAFTQSGVNRAGVWLVPVAAMLLAGAAGQRIGRRHGETWVGRWLVLAVAVKLTASYIRYHTLVNQFEGVGDAIDYDNFGREFATAWLTGGAEPELGDLRQHNFIRWFTGVVYYLFGIDMITGFLVFGLLAVVGSYLWYRATVDSVPNVDKRLYLALVLFLPSIAYWPSGIGKESVMQLAIGMVALATSLVLRQRLMSAFLVGAPGTCLLWYVRPHLLAMVMAAVGCAYLAGRVKANASHLPGFVGRPIGLLLVALVVGFAVVQGAEFLGMEDLSVSSIEARLDEQSEMSEGMVGNSTFETGGSSLNPLKLPEGAITVLLRPFPWETDSPLQLLASLESAALAALMMVRLSSFGAALTRARAWPFLLFCWVLVVLYAATFSAIGNFGVIVRQRSLVLPALFALLALRPVRATADESTIHTMARSATSGGVRAGS